MKNVPPVVIVHKKRPASTAAAPAAPIKKPPVKKSPLQTKASAPVPSQPPLEALPQPAPSAPLPPPDPPQPSARKRRIRQALALLQERWPQTFPTDFRQARPFAMGMHHEIVKALPDVKPYILSQTIALYQRGGKGAYWRAILKGGARYTLDGTPNGEVTDKDKEHAKQELATIAAWWKARRGGRPRSDAPQDDTGNAPASIDAE